MDKKKVYTMQDTAEVTMQDNLLNNSEIGKNAMQDTMQVTMQVTPQVTAQDNLLNNSKIGCSTAQVTAQVKVEVTAQVIRLLRILGDREMNKAELMKVLGMSHVENFRLTYLQPALKAGLIEMTIPDKPNSRLQKYRRTGKELNL